MSGQNYQGIFMPVTCMAIGAGATAAAWLWWRRQVCDEFKAERDYASWLKRAPEPQHQTALLERDSAVFSTFLRNSGPKADSTATGTPALAVGEPPSQGVELGEEDVELLVMFGTEYGFSKEVADKVAAELSTAPYRSKVVDMGHYPEGYPLSTEQVALVVCSTQGDGVPPSEARPFVDWLDIAPQLQRLHFSVLALGDRSYTNFAACGKRIDAALEKRGARRLAPRVDVHMEDWTTIHGWIDGVKQALPSLTLSPTRSLGLPRAGIKQPNTATAGRRYGRSNPYFARVTKVQSLCSNLQSSEDKDTVQVELDLNTKVSGLTYMPGDALGVMPLNPEQAVDEILGYCGMSEDETVSTPSWHYQSEGDGEMALGWALRLCYDLRSPKPALLRQLWDTMDEGERDTAQGVRLRELVGGLDAGLHEEGPVGPYLSQRHVIDILEDFSAVHLPLETLLSCLRPLQPRLYSISSSPFESEGRVQITVAVVRYNCLDKDRVGVASTFLGERTRVGDTVAVYTSKNPDFRLPHRPEAPIIMVGPGTGVAPFRAFIQHRQLCVSEATPRPGPALLFFGCRRRDQDFLYRDLLEGWDSMGAVQLQTAFSREGSRKVYVQHRLRECGNAVWELLQAGGHFYVCGDAQHMAGDVEAALLDIIAERQAGGRPAAAAYLDNLRANDRYQRDVWF